MEDNTDKSNKKSKKNWYILALIIGLILIIIFVIWFLMRGETKTTGDYPEDTTPESLECVGKNIPYKIFADTLSDIEIKINGIFINGKIGSISLVYKSKYNSAEAAKTMSDAHEGDMNMSFYKNNMNSYSLNATYTINENVAQMSLYANSSDLNDISAKYFMLDSLPKNLTEYKKDYIAKGFSCEITK